MRVPKIIRSTTVPQSLNVFCKGVLQELSKKYEVVGLSSPGKDLDEVANREGVRVIGVSMERHISVVKDIVALVRLIRIFRNEKPTMVHSMTPKAGLLSMVAAWLSRVPLRVHTFTGLVFPTSTGIKRKILMLTDWMTCACATHIIPEGEGVRNDLVNFRITKKTLKVLGFGNVRGVDMDYYSFRPEIIEIVSSESLRKPECFTFLYVGRIVSDKGINELIEAFAKLHSHYPKTRLWLVGPFEDKLNPISERARKEIKENDAIIATGTKWGDELVAYYAAADCFVMPSYREGFPNTVLEAGAMDLPSIVTDINGSREIINEGENGIIVPSHDASALFEAMLYMLTESNARVDMAHNARDIIAARFDQRFVRRCLYAFYEDILRPYV